MNQIEKELERLHKENPHLANAPDRCRLTIETAHGLAHTGECRSRFRLKRYAIRKEQEHKTISRMVDVLAAAGGSLDEWEVCRRAKPNGATWNWASSLEAALDEGIVAWHGRPMLGLCPKPPTRSAGWTAEQDALAKARVLGVVVRSGDHLVFTRLVDAGLVSPGEIVLAQRGMRYCNVGSTATLLGLFGSHQRGEITDGELDARISEMNREAEEVNARMAEVARRAAAKARRRTRGGPPPDASASLRPATMFTSPGIVHCGECTSRFRLKRKAFEDTWTCETISRTIDALAEAGGALEEWDAYRLVMSGGGVWDWEGACVKAVREGILERPDRKGLCLNTMSPTDLPTDSAERGALDKAYRLGVVELSGAAYAFTGLRDAGLLTPGEAMLAERAVRHHNAADPIEVPVMGQGLLDGEITRDEFDARVAEMVRRADEDALQVRVAPRRARARK